MDVQFVNSIQNSVNNEIISNLKQGNGDDSGSGTANASPAAFMASVVNAILAAVVLTITSFMFRYFLETVVPSMKRFGWIAFVWIYKRIFKFHFDSSQKNRWVFIMIQEEIPTMMQRNVAYNAMIWYFSNRADQLKDGIVEVECFSESETLFVNHPGQQRKVRYKDYSIYHVIQNPKKSNSTGSNDINSIVSTITFSADNSPSPTEESDISENNLLKYLSKNMKLSYGNSTIPIPNISHSQNKYILLSMQYHDNTILIEFVKHCIRNYFEHISENNWVQKLLTLDSDLRWKEDNLTKNIGNRSIDSVFLEKGVKERILNDLDFFFNHKEWYERRNIPYHRNLLFFGPPGCGKTSLILALSQHYKKHLAFLSLQDIDSDSRLRTLCNSLDSDTILVLEDIDCVLSSSSADPKLQSMGGDILTSSLLYKNPLLGRRDRDSSQTTHARQVTTQGFSFSCLLNIIDGAFHKQGRVIIMTTNHPDKLDAALLRPGRCDLKIELGLASTYQIEKMFENFFEHKDMEIYRDQLPDRVLSPAKIVSIFIENRNDSKQALLSILKSGKKQTGKMV